MTRTGEARPGLVIFDCDGTLVDSQEVIVAAMAMAFEAEGLSGVPRADVLAIIGLSLDEAFSRLTDGAGAAAVGRLTERYRQAFYTLRQRPDHHEPLYHGAKSAIEHLADVPHVLLGIATGKSRRGVRALLEREGLTGHFTTIQTADTSPSKPHPDMILRAIAETGAAPEDTVMIGDTTYDIEMARNAGVRALAVAWGYHAGHALMASGADMMFDDFSELLAELTRQFMPGGAAA